MIAKLNRSNRIALLTWLAGLLVSALVIWWVHLNNHRLFETRLVNLTDRVPEVIESRFRLYEYGLHATRDAVIAMGSQTITREKFAAYMASRDMAREFPGARGFGFIRVVPRTDEAQFLAKARAEGPADFNIRELAPNTGDRFVIQYLYPISNNHGATGLDVASETNRREAALVTAREGKIQLTAPITLVQAGAQPRRGFLAYLPIYHAGAAVHTPEAREAAILGWVYLTLVVDDVLADLGPLTQEIGFRLSDSAEKNPFFESLLEDRAEVLADVRPISRELAIFGRRWLIHSQALTPLATASQPLPLSGVAAIALFMSTMLAVMVSAFLQRRTENRVGGSKKEAYDTTTVTLRRFFGSPLARWSGLAYFVFLTVYLVISYRGQWAQQMDLSRRALSDIVDDRASNLKITQASRRKTMAFLAEILLVKELVRSLPKGSDPQNSFNLKLWEERMQLIFTAYLKTSPEVYQVRFIGAAENSREMIRIVRRGQDVIATSKTQLQAKDNLHDMQQILRLQAGEVWISDFELYEENGKLEQPHRPTIRYATPVYQASGKVLGIIIVHINLAQRLAEVAALTPPGGAIHITNAAGDFLLHPDPVRRFGFNLGQPYRWDNEFEAAELPYALANDRLQTWRGPQGLIVAATAVVTPNTNSDVGTIRYMASLPLATLETAVWRAVAKRSMLPLAAGVSAWLLLYFFWSSVQRQLQVRGQRLRLAAIVDQSTDAIIGLNALRAVISWNRGAVQLFGFEESEAIGHLLLRLISATTDIDHLFKANGNIEICPAREFECRDREGRHLNVAMSFSRLGGEHGEESSVIIRDVTKERTAQYKIVELNRDLEQQVEDRTARLLLERQRLNNILHSTHVGTWELNFATGAALFNERWADMIGYCLDELMPISIDTWANHIHPEDLLKAWALLQSHFDGKVEYYSIEIRMRHKSKGWIWVVSRGRLSSRTSEGEPEWMYGTHQDITVIKEAELEVQRVAALLSSVLSSATEISIIATDAQGLIKIFNAGAEQLLGYRHEEMVGISSPTRLHLPVEVAARGAELSVEYGTTIEGFRVFVHKVELEGSEQREWTYVRKDGSHVTVFLMVTTLRDKSNRITGYLGIAHDISERLRAESELRHAKAAAEAASAAKSLFLANMSHEIRTPMNAVIGVTHLLEYTSLDADQRQLLEKLLIAGRSLMGIINNVLDFSKIEAGEMSVEEAPMNPVELLRDLQQMFSPQARAKGIALELYGLNSLPPRLITDELRVRQILVNLISNAVKFTAKGQVNIQVQRELDAEQQPWVKWTVCDSGIGISPDVLTKLFSPFVQADELTTRRFGGTGLGLSIVRKLAGLLGGEVGVRSQLGMGSEFWLRLPLIEAGVGNLEPIDSADSSLNIVVVDDNPDDRSILASMCRSLGWRAVELASGEALVAHCIHITDAQQALPDALLVNWQMPGLDGLQALQNLADNMDMKNLSATLIISAHERNGIALLDQQHLVDQILIKPVGSSELFNAVNCSVSRHTGGTDRVARCTRIDAIDAKWLPGVKVLIVDDSDINLEVARRLLEREEAVVLTATNGLEALALLRCETNRFDAVLMDVHMSVMDGYETTRLIRTELGLKDLPVLALTASALGEERRRAEAAGMNDFLTKPLDPQSLVRALRRAVEAARGQPLQLTLSTKTPEMPSDWPLIDGIDNQDVLHRVGQDVELFLRMLDRLLREFASIRFACSAYPDDATNMDRDALGARLHKLYGSAGLLGAYNVCRLAGEAENALKAGVNVMDVQITLMALEQALQRLEQAARPVIDARLLTSLPSDVIGSDVSVLNVQAVTQLLSLLRQQDLTAGEKFRELASALAAQWGSTLFGQVRRAIEDLDFSQALRLIDGASEQTSENRTDV
jgi:PAS domain S-box-containing protein